MLPKISMPVFTIADQIGKKWSFRPMLVKEEKILLMAKESTDETDILGAIKQVVHNCCLDKGFKVDNISTFELENMFLKIRGFSIGDEIKVAYRDFEDDKVYNFTVSLKDVHVKMPENNNNPKIEITATSGIIMRYPEAGLYADKDYLHTKGEDSFYKLVANCIEVIYDGDAVHEAKNFKHAELLEFVELIDLKTFQKIREFMSNLPTLYYKIEYENTLKNKRTIELTTLSDFFTLR